MRWSKYTFSEKWKIIKSKIFHKNIVCMAMHTQDLELFKKILLVENIVPIKVGLYKLVCLDIANKDKYTAFFQELYNYPCDNSSNEDKIIFKLYLESIINQKPTRQSCHNYEETLDYYLNSKNENTNNTKHNLEHSSQIEVLPELNYADLDWANY